MRDFLPLQLGMAIKALPAGLDNTLAGDWALCSSFYAGGARKLSHEHYGDNPPQLQNSSNSGPKTHEVMGTSKKGDILTYDMGIPRHKRSVFDVTHVLTRSARGVTQRWMQLPTRTASTTYSTRPPWNSLS